MSYPQDAPRGPVVALADEFAGSDGDIVTAAIQTLRPRPGGRHPHLGRRHRHRRAATSWSTAPRITVPRYAFWFDGLGWDVENYGVDPDVEVVISPGDWAAGRDPQLETAVRLALEALEARPAAAAPDTARRPSRRRPPLPCARRADPPGLRPRDPATRPAAGLRRAGLRGAGLRGAGTRRAGTRQVADLLGVPGRADMLGDLPDRPV